MGNSVGIYESCRREPEVATKKRIDSWTQGSVPARRGDAKQEFLKRPGPECWAFFGFRSMLRNVPLEEVA